MSDSGKNSLIMQLYHTFVNPQKNEESRYSADTNTLYTTGKETPGGTNDYENTRGRITEVVLEKEEFEEILCGRSHFAIIPDNGVRLQGEVKFRECNNLIPTGRYAIKAITQIAKAKNVTGIKDNYVVIGWE